MELRKCRWTCLLIASAAVLVEPGMCWITGEYWESSEIQRIILLEGSFMVVRCFRVMLSVKTWGGCRK